MLALNRLAVRRSLLRLQSFSTAHVLCQKKTDFLPPLHPPKDTSKRRILILSPEETKDKIISKFVDDLGRSVRRKSMPKHISQLVEGNVYDKSWDSAKGSVEDNINHFKPKGHLISSFQAHSLIESLVLSFKKDQLQAFVRQHDMPMPRKTKHQIAETIVKKIWKYKVTLRRRKFKKELLKREGQIIREETLSLSKFEIFLLLSQQGKLWKDVKSSLSEVQFAENKTQMVMRGSESQIENARILMSTHVDNCYREEVDLSSIKRLYEEKFGEFSVKDVGKFTEVYFTHLEGDKYELASLNPNQIKRIRRLFLWHLGYNLHKKELLQLPSAEDIADSAFLPYINDYSQSWKERGGPHYHLKSEYIPPASNSLKDELERFSEEKLSQLESQALATGHDYSEVNDRAMAKETYELLESIGLMEDDVVEKAEKPQQETPEQKATDKDAQTKDVSDTAAATTPVRKDLALSKQVRDAIYKELTDFLYRKSLKGVSNDQLEVPVFTVTLGTVLFGKNSPGEHVDLSVTVELLESRPRIFNTNVSLAFDHALSSTVTKQELGSLDEDPHVYSLQFKFTPSPFVEEFTDKSQRRSLEQQIQYPPVEMWVQLNAQSVPDLETLQVVTVEAENNSLVCCPHSASDLRVGCQITGRLLQDEAAEYKESEEAAESASASPSIDLDTLLLSPTSKYERFLGQPGIGEFLEKSELDFSGKKPTSIAPWIVLDVAGNKIRYDYVNTSYRRELTLETEGDVAVQLAVVDGGLLGGRRVETRFIGDYSAGVDRGNFEQLLDYTEEFLNKL